MCKQYRVEYESDKIVCGSNNMEITEELQQEIKDMCRRIVEKWLDEVPKDEN